MASAQILPQRRHFLRHRFDQNQQLIVDCDAGTICLETRRWIAICRKVISGLQERVIKLMGRNSMKPKAASDDHGCNRKDQAT